MSWLAVFASSVFPIVLLLILLAMDRLLRASRATPSLVRVRRRNGA